MAAARSNASFADPGFLLFGRQDSLMAQRFDVARLRTAGEAFPVADGVGRSNQPFRQYSFSVSWPGVLVWRSSFSGNVQVASYSREGKRVASIGEPRFIREFTLSPDEKRLAVQLSDPGSGSNIWVLDLASGIFSRVTYDPAFDGDPFWSPNSREIVFTSNRKGHVDLYRKVIGGPPEELLYESPEPKYTAQWLADGSILTLNLNGKSFFRLPLTGERKPVLLFQSEFDKDGPTVSADGRWIAYNSNESGRWEVYVASFPAFTEQRQVSNSGGCQPRWRKDGKELFYITLEGQMMAVDIKTGAAPEAGLPHELFRVPLHVGPTINQYAVTADGRKFLVMENVAEDPGAFTVVLDWTAGLKR